MVECSSDSSEGDTPVIVQAPIKTMASISASLPPISGSAKYNSISDFPDIPYSVISTKCLGELYSDRICFKLPPHVAKIYCPFNYHTGEENQIILSIVPAIVSIPLEINGQGIIYTGQEIDITDRMRNGDNHFVFNTMNLIVTVVASVQWRMSQNYSFLVNKIIEEHPPMILPIGSQFTTTKCPLSNEEIRYPGRGCLCTHSQCFDLMNFLKHANETGNWGCPVCGLTLYDHFKTRSGVFEELLSSLDS
ncbi:MIZ zinc finger family protein [Trichomonas vaginalis G3]|uniref:MIZ zinc finger family protein n=1 Tax=Trichomonas vaginalis (strain ATCC PRA-98 / G3) TaxID=412133 RepID=A2F566_TRIV3|nr:SUMO transferase protein [Trichomonas vaginalis G3]EAX99959.1 MIZ zinc finger family protein [Trichomonas vaginalis G3]KAI5516724.1 SUMO transferase protein [Trichomonas vaginalis G3]|eukprot:XP_001312889.1 MIZ zinc finger family protein [Trichomonas vaginalis G3]